MLIHVRMSPRRIQKRGDLGLIAGHRAVAADVVLFQVRGGDPQHVAFPRRGGKPAPGVVGFRRRRVAAVEIHRHVGGLVPLGLVGDDLAGERIDFLRDAELRRAAVDVGPAVRPALVFRKAQDRGVPAFGAGQPVGVERQADAVADPRVFGVVHRADHRPLAGEVDLRAPRCPRTRRAASTAIAVVRPMLTVTLPSRPDRNTARLARSRRPGHCAGRNMIL